MNQSKSLEPADPSLMVIFGGSGDLAFRKLLPALYHLEKQGLLPSSFAVLSVSRTELTTEAYGERARKELAQQLRAEPPLDEKALGTLVERLRSFAMDATDEKAYARLGSCLEALAKERGTRGNAVFYLAVPPRFFGPIVQGLGKAGLTREGKGFYRRVVIEKPFGHDLASARQLNRLVGQWLAEEQVFRIDHYLGKETVQNLLVLRFANGIFEPIWNREHIDSVQITVAETLGVESRGNYYEKSGALRDMVPNHLFQLMSMIAMEAPNSFGAEDVRSEKHRVLRAIQPLKYEDVIARAVRGQYGPGHVKAENGEEKAVQGYTSEPKVARDSATETFVALRMDIDNWRWAGVPFYLRTGKRLGSRTTEITIQFKMAPAQLFREVQAEQLPPNQLVLQIQPEERISLQFGAKVPGPKVHVADVAMDFCYEDYFGSIPSTGYETLIYDCLRGDPTLFQRGDHVEAAWQVIAPIQEVWSTLKPKDFPNYAAGSWGPRAAEELLARDGRQWRLSEHGVRVVSFPEGLPQGPQSEIEARPEASKPEAAGKARPA